MTIHEAPAGDPIELARFGSSEAENGLNGISLGILVSSADGASAIGHLALSRQAMSPASLRANPRFLYDDTEGTEVLLSFGTEGQDLYTYGTSASLMAAVKTVSGAAVEAQAPILFMQSPVAHHRPLPTQRRADGSAERVREPFAPVLRAAVGIDRRHPRRRLDFVRRLSSFAKEYGMGLDIKDRRPGMARGDWFELNHMDDELIRTHQKELSGANEALHVPRTRPICIVGPARVGSTAACIDLLDGVGAGVCGVSITALHDIAVLGLIVPALDALPARPPDLRPDQSPKARTAPIDDLGSLERAKFSIPPIVEPPLKTQAEVLTEVCARAEAACKEIIFEGEIRIAWRERWLGRLGELMP